MGEVRGILVPPALGSAAACALAMKRPSSIEGDAGNARSFTSPYMRDFSRPHSSSSPVRPGALQGHSLAEPSRFLEGRGNDDTQFDGIFAGFKELRTDLARLGRKSRPGCGKRRVRRHAGNLHSRSEGRPGGEGRRDVRKTAARAEVLVVSASTREVLQSSSPPGGVDISVDLGTALQARSLSRASPPGRSTIAHVIVELEPVRCSPLMSD